MDRRSFLSTLGLAPLAAVVPAFAFGREKAPPVIGSYEVVEAKRGMKFFVSEGPVKITEVRLGGVLLDEGVHYKVRRVVRRGGAAR